MCIIIEILFQKLEIHFQILETIMELKVLTVVLLSIIPKFEFILIDYLTSGEL